MPPANPARNESSADPWATQWPLLLLAETDVATDLAAVPWPDVIAAAKSHGLLGALAGRLLRSGRVEAVPPQSKEALVAAYRASSAAMLAKRAASLIALDALAAVDVVPVGYKGIALANFVYPEAAMRSMSDIDLWLPEGEMDDAVDALARAGFIYRPSRESRSAAWQAAFGGEIKMQHPRLGLVELHYDVFPGEWLQRATSIDREAIRSRLSEGLVQGRRLRLLAPRDHLVQVALHAAISNRHSIAGLRGLLDVALLAEQVQDWDSLMSDVTRWRVRRVMAHVLLMAGAIFRRACLSEMGRALADGVSTRSLDWHIDPDGLLMHRKLLGPISRWSFLLCSTDRIRDAAHLLRHTLWPDANWIGLRYGDTRAARRLEHLVNVARGQV